MKNSFLMIRLSLSYIRVFEKLSAQFIFEVLRRTDLGLTIITYTYCVLQDGFDTHFLGFPGLTKLTGEIDYFLQKAKIQTNI